MGNLRMEKWKFAVYLVVPVMAVYLYSMPSVYETVLKNRRYVVYPAAPKEDDRALPELPRGAGKDWALGADATPAAGGAPAGEQKMA